MTALLSSVLILFALLIVWLWVVRDKRSRSETQAVLRRRRHTPWKVEKHVIVQVPESALKHSVSTELARTDDVDRHMQAAARYVETRLEWPRAVQVTISNLTQVVLIGEAQIDEEDRVNELVHEADARCGFLNAHEVK